MTSSRRPAALLLATLLLVGSAMHPASAQEAVRPEVGKPLQAAQELIKGQHFKEALAKLREVDNVPNKTANEQQLLDRMRGSAALGAGDADLAEKSFTSVFASGKMSDADQGRIAASLASVYYRNGNYKASVNWAGKALKANPGDSATRTLLIQGLYLSGDYAAAAREALVDIQASEKAGQAPPEDRLQLLANCYAKQGNDPAGYASALERLVSYYPKKEYWADLLQRIGEKPSFSPRLQLDLDRLRVATRTLTNPNELMEMAELSLTEGLAGEAKRVLDDGFASGVLGKSGDANRQQRLRALANQRAADAPKDLATAGDNAIAAKDADALVKVGFGWAALGQFDKGLPMMQKGIAMGGLKRPADAALHYGIALIQAGQKPKAAQAFKGATGNDGTSDLARLWQKVP